MAREENVGDVAKNDVGVAGRDPREAGYLSRGKKCKISVELLFHGGVGATLARRVRATCQTRRDTGDGEGGGEEGAPGLGKRLWARGSRPSKRSSLEDKVVRVVEGGRARRRGHNPQPPGSGWETGGATARPSPEPLSSSSQTRDRSRRVSALPLGRPLCFFPPAALPFFSSVPIPPPSPHLLSHVPIATRAAKCPPLRPILRLFIG